jgi:single-stranded DNA-binding protein
MNYQKLMIAGNATVDPEKKRSKDEKVSYSRFSVGVSDGKEKTTFFPVVVFGEYGETVAEFVRKGSQVLVEGRVRISEKGQFSVVADRVVFGSSARQKVEAD